MPDVYWNLTSERVVTMEYVPGVKINNLEEIERRGIDRQLLAKRSAEAYLTQLCRHGFFHCDPHPVSVFFLGNPWIEGGGGCCKTLLLLSVLSRSPSFAWVEVNHITYQYTLDYSTISSFLWNEGEEE